MNTRGHKTKLRLYGLLLCMTLSFALSSCYGPELDFINDKINVLENRLDSLKAKLETKKFIQSVTPIERGFRVTFDDTSYYDITSGINGARGENGTSWIIDEHGMWRYSTATGGYMDSGFRAVPNDGKDGAQGKNGKAAPSPKIRFEVGPDGKPYGFWTLYELIPPADTAYQEVRTNIPANMAPYVRYYSDFIAMFIPKIDSITYNPPQIVIDSIALPFYFEEPYLISFKGYAHIDTTVGTAKTIQMLDNLSFKYWQVTHSSALSFPAWGGTKEITQDTLMTLGLPLIDANHFLVAVYSPNRQISLPRLALQDSKRDQNDFFNLSDPVKITDELLTKAYYDTLFYAKMNLNTAAPSSPKTGNIQHFLVHADTVRSAESYPISAQSPAIPGVPVQTIGGNNPATRADSLFTDTRYRYFKVDSTATAIRLTFSDSAYVFDYFIKDTAIPANSIVNIGADKKSFTFKAATSPPWADTASYKLVVSKLMLNGNIQIDTIVVSTRDSVRDLIKHPLP